MLLVLPMKVFDTKLMCHPHLHVHVMYMYMYTTVHVCVDTCTVHVNLFLQCSWVAKHYFNSNY